MMMMMMITMGAIQSVSMGKDEELAMCSRLNRVTTLTMEMSRIGDQPCYSVMMMMTTVMLMMMMVTMTSPVLL